MSQAYVCEPLATVIKGKLMTIVKEETREQLLYVIGCTRVNDPRTNERRLT